ncbi:MAG: hypothetical protein D6718_04295, partial [Acidobacteria bacterium]
PTAAPPLFGTPRAAPDPPAVEEAARIWCAGRRRLVIAGPAPPGFAAAARAAARLAAETPAVLAAEATSQLRHHPQRDPGLALDGLEWLAAPGGFLDRQPPEAVLLLHGAPAGRWTLGWLERTPARLLVAAPRWCDPVNRAEAVLVGDPEAALDLLAEASRRLRPAGADTEWLGAVREADARAWRGVEQALRGGGPMPEPAAVAEVLGALPDGAQIQLGNSLAVRLADIAAPGSHRALTVLHQRGASGIDGFVSSAAGAAAATGRPTVALGGDLSFAHDAGGLAAARAVRVPLVLAVLANGGGRLFDLLPVAARADLEKEYRDRFRCPTPIDFAALAAAYGLPHRRAATRNEVRAALEEALGRPGPTLVEIVPDPPGARAFLEGAARRS